MKKIIRKKKPKKLTEGEFNIAWNALHSPEPTLGSNALFTLLSGGKEVLPTLLKVCEVPGETKAKEITAAEVAPVLARLSHYRYLVREPAFDEFYRMGPNAVPHLKAAIEKATSDELLRLQHALNTYSTIKANEHLRLRRTAILLRHFDDADAKSLLAKIEKVLGQ